jgi:precorrin-4 methylase
VGTSEATRYKGLMSDFRIYASALTSSQILELYESKAEIDKNQNVFTNEIVEQNNSNMTNANS